MPSGTFVERFQQIVSQLIMSQPIRVPTRPRADAFYPNVEVFQMTPPSVFFGYVVPSFSNTTDVDPRLPKPPSRTSPKPTEPPKPCTSLPMFQMNVRCAIAARPHTARHAQFVKRLGSIVREMGSLAERALVSFTESKYEETLEAISTAYMDLQCGNEKRLSVCAWGASETDVDNALMSIAKLANAHFEAARIWEDRPISFKIMNLLIDAWTDVAKSDTPRPIAHKHMRGSGEWNAVAAWLEFVDTCDLALDRVNASLDVDALRAFLKSSAEGMHRLKGWTFYARSRADANYAYESMARWSHAFYI